MGTFAEKATVDYCLSLANKGKRTFVFRSSWAANKQKYAVSVFRHDQTEIFFEIITNFRLILQNVSKTTGTSFLVSSHYKWQKWYNLCTQYLHFYTPTRTFLEIWRIHGIGWPVSNIDVCTLMQILALGGGGLGLSLSEMGNTIVHIAGQAGQLLVHQYSC